MSVMLVLSPALEHMSGLASLIMNECRTILKSVFGHIHNMSLLLVEARSENECTHIAGA